MEHRSLVFMDLCLCHTVPTPAGIYLCLVVGADVEHGHGAVGGAVARYELFCADVWGADGWGGRA